MTKMPLYSPKITSPYNVVRTIFGKTSIHKGIDMIDTYGSKSIYAIKDGTYRGCFYDKKGFGNYVSIQHDDGIRTIYAHMERVMSFKKGERIKAGTEIGIMGTTGNSTGVHLHIEGRKKPYSTSDRIDIAEYLGIENKIGEVKLSEKTNNMNIVQCATGFEEQTMQFLDSYEYNEELFSKLAKAIQRV